MKQLRNISEVVQARLCIGCGACASVAGPGKVRMHDYYAEGLRPHINSPLSPEENQATLDACPAVSSDYTLFDNEPCHLGVDSSFEKKWGHITEIWEGYAADEEIRHQGASGGALTAISLYCIEQLGMSGTLHIAQDPDRPIRNRTTFSKNRADLMKATGSRYSPASVCDSLRIIEEADAPCALIGKPAEISAARNVAKIRPKFAKKLGVTLSFFCAETPPNKATDALLKSLDIEPDQVTNLRYRGFGWPGHFAPTVRNEQEPKAKQTYSESWDFLQRLRPWSTQLWPDGSGELADITCGDPWYEQPDDKNPGFSLVVARSEKGRKIIEGAISSGYLALKKAEPWKLEKSQLGLLNKKGAVWGRRLVMKMLGMRTTTFPGLELFSCWRLLPLDGKMRSTLGTLRRLLQRKLYKPFELDSPPN